MEGLSLADATSSELFARLMPDNPNMRHGRKRIEHLPEAPLEPAAPPCTAINSPESHSSGSDQPQLTYDDILKMLNTPSPDSEATNPPHGINGVNGSSDISGINGISGNVPMNTSSGYLNSSAPSSNGSATSPSEHNSGCTQPNSRHWSPADQWDVGINGSFDAPLYTDSDGSGEFSHPHSSRHGPSQGVPSGTTYTPFTDSAGQNHAIPPSYLALGAQAPDEAMGFAAPRSAVPVTLNGYPRIEDLSRSTSYNTTSHGSTPSFPSDAGPSRPSSSMMYNKQNHQPPQQQQPSRKVTPQRWFSLTLTKANAYLQK